MQKLWIVRYRTWRKGCRSMKFHEDLSVGETAEEAIQRVRETTQHLIGSEEFRNYKAELVEEVFGFNIKVEEKK